MRKFTAQQANQMATEVNNAGWSILLDEIREQAAKGSNNLSIMYENELHASALRHKEELNNIGYEVTADLHRVVISWAKAYEEVVRSKQSKELK